MAFLGFKLNSYSNGKILHLFTNGFLKVLSLIVAIISKN